MYFYNTLTRKVEYFSPQKVVRIYTCGPTVYNHAHIGNFRTYVFEDLLHRYLETRNHQVLRVMNLTDVDDKTIQGALRAGISLSDYTAPYKKSFFNDMKALRLRSATHYPAATDPENIAAMIAIIDHLLSRGHAYQAEDHSIYFRISSFKSYGSLARVNFEAQRSSARIRSDEYTKEEIADFALWKAWNQADGAVYWESPWGKGRPGWHLECSAMAMRLLGDQIDIHCGGIDNIFPHHEAEIAQCECVSGKKFVRLWMHAAHLMVEGTKMAKSAGNFYTVGDLLEQGWSGREIRYALLSVHYRTPLNFTMEGLEAARQSLHRLDEWIRRLHDITRDHSSSPGCLETLGPISLNDFFSALDHDLNISAALAVLFEVIRHSHRLLNEDALSIAEVVALLAWWRKVNSILALEPDLLDEEIPEEIKKLALLREKARASKNWNQSDLLRQAIEKQGWSVQDTKSEQKIIRKIAPSSRSNDHEVNIEKFNRTHS